MPDTMPSVPIAAAVVGPMFPSVDAARVEILRELQVVALDNSRALQAFDSGASDICAELRLLAASEAWSSPAQRCLAIEAGLLADAISLVATAAALAAEEYRSAHSALAVELEGGDAR